MAEQVKTPYEIGYEVAVREIADGTASFVQAQQRGTQMDQDDRIEWDRGYADAICAYRLGHDPWQMARMQMHAPSVFSEAEVVFRLLDGTWTGTVRPDPRRRDG